MNTAPPTDGGTDERYVDLLAGHLDRSVRRSRGAASAAGSTPGDTPTGDLSEPVPTLARNLLAELRAEPTWSSGPPSGLRDIILAQARASTVESFSTGPEAVAPSPTGPDVRAVPEGTGDGGQWWWRPVRWRPRIRRLGWALPAAALGAAAFTVLVLGVDRLLAPDPPPAEVFVASGTGLAPGATAKVSIVDTPSGVSVIIEPDRLPAAAPGSYYAAWVKGPRGSVPIGSFHERRTGVPIELWSGVELADYPTLTVTLQAEDAPPTPSGLVVLSASLAR